MSSTDNTNQPPVETIYGQIVAKANNYQAVPDGAGSRRIIKNNKIRDYERSFLRQCKIYAGAKIDTPFELNATIYYQNYRYDLDNSLKTLLDCLQYAGAITDDCHCVRLKGTKLIDRTHPRVVFSIIAEPPHPTLFDP